MRTGLFIVAAAATLGTAAIGVAPASARDYHHGYHHDRGYHHGWHDNNWRHGRDHGWHNRHYRHYGHHGYYGRHHRY